MKQAVLKRGPFRRPGPGAEEEREDLAPDEAGSGTPAEEDGAPEEEPQGGRMSLLAHLAELRRRLIVCVLCFLVSFSLCLSQSERFTSLLLSRGSQFSFVYIAPAELLLCYIRVAFVCGVVITVPVIVYEVWKFVQPGLRRKEQLGFAVVMIFGLALFCLGTMFCFYIVLPILLGFFARLDTTHMVTAMVSIQEYISYVLSTMVTFGLIFETPILLLALTGLGLVRPKTLKKNFKYVVLIILIVAAIITPPDVTSQILAGVPLMVLFYASILLCQVVFRRKLAREEEEER